MYIYIYTCMYVYIYIYIYICIYIYIYPHRPSYFEVDVSGQIMMKGTECDKHCESQNSANQKGFERTPRFRDIPEGMPTSVSTPSNASHVYFSVSLHLMPVMYTSSNPSLKACLLQCLPPSRFYLMRRRARRAWLLRALRGVLGGRCRVHRG